MGAPNANEPSAWTGQNLLGTALMVVRDILRKELDVVENVHVVNATSPRPYNLNRWETAELDKVELYVYKLSAAYREFPVNMYWGNIAEFLVANGIVVDSAGIETFLQTDAWKQARGASGALYKVLNDVCSAFSGVITAVPSC